MSTAIARVPIAAGGAVSTDTSAAAATGPATATESPSATPSAGPQVTSPTENPLYVSTDPNGNASGLFLFGGAWQTVVRILKDADLAASAAAKQFLVKGKIVHAGVQFDSQGRPASSFFSNLLDASGSPTTQPLSQSGTSTTILVAAATWQFGDHQISYNSGSVDPGSFGTFDVYADDPFHSGGAAIFSAVVVPSTAVVAKRGRIYVGRITTVSGGGGTGGGGGTSGGGGGRFYL